MLKTFLCLRLAQHCPLEAGAIVTVSSSELLVLKVPSLLGVIRAKSMVHRHEKLAQILRSHAKPDTAVYSILQAFLQRDRRQKQRIWEVHESASLT